jgi:hypothetical protein
MLLSVDNYRRDERCHSVNLIDENSEAENDDDLVINRVDSEEEFVNGS